MPLVWAVIRRAFPRGEDDPCVRRAGGLDDLAQEGYLALRDAERTHDPARGSFSTWAWRRVRWRLAGACRRGGVVACPAAPSPGAAGDAARARRCGRLTPPRARGLAAPPPAWPAPEDLEAAREAVAALPEAQRRAVADMLLGRTPAEAARAAGRDPAALRLTWLRAVARCR